VGYAQTFGQFPDTTVTQQDEAHVLGSRRGLVGQASPQRALLVTLKWVSPPKGRRPGQAGGDPAQD